MLKVSKQNIKYIILSFIGFVLTGIFCFFLKINIAIICSLLTVYYTYKIFRNSIYRVNSISFFFLFFFILYTYSPILTIVFDIDTRGFFTESNMKSISSYLFVCTTGLFSFSLPYVVVAEEVEVFGDIVYKSKKEFELYSVFFVFVSILGEMLNIYRAGGFELLAKGKAIYQAETGGLLFTFPSSFFLQVGFFFLGLRLYISYGVNILKSIKNKLFLLVTIISMPLIMVYLSVGFRSPLLGVAIAFIMGFGYFTSIKKIKRKIIVVFFLGYSFLAILYGIRGQLRLLFSTGNWSVFNEYVIKQKTFLKFFNPANNEFGASYINYVKFFNDDSKDLLYGSSYLSGFLIPIPRFILPFDKPQAIDYKFRDKYFNEWKKRSRIAGSGFSYVMETQWNFGYLGPFIIYFFTGVFFWSLEYIRNKNKFILLFPLFYAMFLPLSQSMHRSSFGFLISNVITLTFGILLLVIVKKMLPTKNN